MHDRSVTYLKSIIRYCTDITELLHSINSDYESYKSNRGSQYAISFCLEQIGELVKKLRESGFVTQYPNVPWAEIAGLRNRIAHGYDTIDLEMVFDISVADIPQLQENCEHILKQIEK